MMTRKEYLELYHEVSLHRDTKIIHRQYYAQFVTPDIKQIVEETFGYEALAESYGNGGSFIGIHLHNWDAITKTKKELFDLESLRKAGESFSLSTAVCILKEAANQIVESRMH